MSSDLILPPSLLARFASDESDATSSLSSPDPSSATPAMRTLASRRLLSLTPRALSTLDRLMSPASSEKSQFSAASEVLKRSPATRDETLDFGQTLPPALSSAFVSIFSAFASALASPPRTPSSSQPPAAALRSVSPERPSQSAPASIASYPETPPQNDPDPGFTLSLEEGDDMKDDPLSDPTLPAASGLQMTAEGLKKAKKAPAEKPPAKPKAKAKAKAPAKAPAAKKAGKKAK